MGDTTSSGKTMHRAFLLRNKKKGTGTCTFVR